MPNIAPASSGRWSAYRRARCAEARRNRSGAVYVRLTRPGANQRRLLIAAISRENAQGTRIFDITAHALRRATSRLRRRPTRARSLAAIDHRECLVLGTPGRSRRAPSAAHTRSRSGAVGPLPPTVCESWMSRSEANGYPEAACAPGPAREEARGGMGLGSGLSSGLELGPRAGPGMMYGWKLSTSQGCGARSPSTKPSYWLDAPPWSSSIPASKINGHC